MTNKMEEENEYVIKNMSYGSTGALNGIDEIRRESDGIDGEKIDTVTPEMDANEKPVLKREVIKDGFGTISVTDGETTHETIIHRFTLTNRRGVCVQVITYGATITSIMVPDRKGNFDDIVLGYENIEGYRDASNPYFGATMGRVTGIIEDAAFKVAAEEFDLSLNFIGGHHVNGGFKGFDKAIWNAHIQNNKKLILSYMSKDSEEGFPGDLIVNRSFELTSRNELIIVTTATCTKPTLIDVSTHVDWNLASNLAGAKEIYNHYLMINADRYAQKDTNYMTTGKLKKVTGTVFDLRIPRLLGRLIHKVPGGGYDNYLSLTNSDCKSVSFAARLTHAGSGRYLEVLTDQPGLTIYTGNKLYAKECYTIGHPESFWSFKPILPSDHEVKVPENLDEVENLRNSQQSDFGGDHQDVENKVEKVEERNTVESLENKKSLVEDIKEDIDKEIGDSNEAPTEENDTAEIKEQTPPMKGKMGVIYERHGGIRLVPHSCAAIYLKKGKQDRLILEPGKEYTSTTIFKFGVVSEKKPILTEIV
ncbi:galactose mutarotase [Nilaparvata lugens]|uniref:galactose mutarotase n=1 Tax=Nilaparvata lugens TaxID=108931 RepID=UPI00193DDD4A|nr:galactose mutarotase [Nilaparvata lugens]